MFLVIWYAYGISNSLLFDGNELDATYIYSSFSLYTFCISEIITSFPNSIGTIALLALLTFLLKSYSWPSSGINP